MAACVVKSCTQEARGKGIMCAAHWFALPETLREDIRKDTDKGAHTLRAQPSREWLAAASKHVGDLRNLSIRYENGKHKRKFQDAKPQDEPTASAA